MSQLQRTIKVYIHKGDEYYIAECLEIGVVTQGKTLDETLANLQEAVALHLDGEDLTEMGLASNPTLLITMELERGSHVKLRRTLASGQKQTLTVPRHKELDSGTVRAIFRQACRYIPEDELRPLFFV
jgi:predicted RNase H-like HicB family nuclease